MISSARDRKRDRFYFMPNLAKILTKTNNWAGAHSIRNGVILMTALISLYQPLQSVQAEGVPDVFLPAVKEIVQDQPLLISPEEQKSVQDVLRGVCEKHGYGESCGRTLLGILWKESENIAKAVGDNGRAHGYFQIHYKMHKISLACAEDLHCSAEWTLEYLEQNGYPRNVMYAVQCHNGCGINNGYAASALRHGKRLWLQPLAVLSK